MSSYYYFMAQLPFLVYEQKPPMSSGSFISLAESLMDEEDSALIGKLSLDPELESALSTGCQFIDGWREWERTLRLNLAKHRAVYLKRDSTSAVEPPFAPADAALTASKAVTGESNPLDAEILIDKARWNAIDSLAGLDNFDRNQAFAYYLKLLLLERRQAFDAENGFSEYKSLYNQIIEDTDNSPGVIK